MGSLSVCLTIVLKIILNNMALYPQWVMGGQFGILIVLALIFIVARRRQKKRKLVDSIKQKWQLAEMESRLLRSQMHPHFVFNALNSINNLILTNQSEKASDYLVKFSQLLRLQLRYSAEKEIRLKEELETIRLYLLVEELRFSESFTWAIEYPDTLPTEAILVPPMILQPYVENAIWHGLLHKEGDKKITIAIEDEVPGELLVRIIDNGIGMEASAQIAAPLREHRSFGMQLGERRLALLRVEGYDARVEVKHLKNDNNSPLGTEIKLYLPKKTT
ncbi:MAG: hypothetical protein FGM54_01210 [Chitinophagaceae bacterium]|nr:hypothetical protein [Chitinophagaceae bacterium]